jgi:transposase
MLLPYANTASFRLFCEQLSQELAQPSLLVADRASFHQPGSAGPLRLVHLPTACPDLNPVERFFKEVRRQLSNRVFGSLAQAYEAVERVVQTYNEQPHKVSQLTLFPYLQNTQNLS